ncbi:putative glutathione S-transferase parC [Capsicum annuum]|uniref:glutathione transferase n=1 Tax=Capsicum annuum TaxID=4072 RepID=A0A2G3A6S4_CAPAN|nr:putative glutathione S-transferase parC [Capsicum annuum]
MEGTNNDVVLLDFWPSSFGMRLRIALALKGIQYEGREENLFDKSTLLLEMNSVHKKIPVLIHNGKPIYPSKVGVRSVYTLPSLDPILWDYIGYVVVDKRNFSFTYWFLHYLWMLQIYSTGRRVWSGKGEDQEEAKKEFIEILKTLEGELGDKTYFGGDDNLGFVDVALVPFTSWFYSYEICANFSIEAVCPKLVAWARRCMQIESVANSLPHPHKIYDYVLELKHKFGLDTN